MGWNKIWKQAMTQNLPMRIATPPEQTVGFSLHSPLAGSALRISLNNTSSESEAQLGGATVLIGKRIYELTQDHHKEILISGNQRITLDPLPVDIRADEEIEIRLYPLTPANDLNYIEDQAFRREGNLLYAERSLREAPAGKLDQSIPVMLPYLDAIEIESTQDAGVIVAFGDSITAMSRWTKPLAHRLYEQYGSRYVLLNSGICGNCLVYDNRSGEMGALWGMPGLQRFQRDVLEEKNLRAVILSIGTNDISFMQGDTAKDIGVDKLEKAFQDLIGQLKARHIRVIVTNVMPKYSPEDYTPEKDQPRMDFNQWICTQAGIEYFLDWDALAQDSRSHHLLKAGFHQGDYLHPSPSGGLELAESFDLEELVGGGNTKS